MGFKVARIYRKHPMSMVDGGVTVVVERTDGRVREYPDVKKPDAFIAAIWREPSPPDPMRLRLVAASLACYFLSILVGGVNL